MLKTAESRYVNDYLRRAALERITCSGDWIRHELLYRVTPTVRPWWHRAWLHLHWRTVGRFQRWLHRDCNDGGCW